MSPYYEYNTSQCLVHLHDYMFRIIVGWEHEPIVRTVIVAVGWKHGTIAHTVIIGLTARTRLIALSNTMLKVIKTWD